MALEQISQMTVYKGLVYIKTYLECVSLLSLLSMEVLSGTWQTQVVVACKNQNIFRLLIALCATNVVLIV